MLVYLMAARVSVDADTWWHLRAGQWMIENRQILTKDLFSYTRYEAEWRYPGWLIEIPMAFIESKLGLGGLNILTGMVIAATFGFIFATLQGNELVRAFLIILAATVSGMYWSARPHLFTLLFTALFLYLLESSTRRGLTHSRRSLLIILPALMFCWVNSHGGFIVGFIVWGIYFIERLIEQVLLILREGRRIKDVFLDQALHTLILIGLGMGILAFLNPLGPQIFLYPFRTVSIQQLRAYIQEWQSPDFHSLSLQPFIWLLILLLFVSAFSEKNWKIRDFLLVSVFLYLALIAGRNVALFALVAPLPISRMVAESDWSHLFASLNLHGITTRNHRPPKDYPKLNLFLLSLIFLGCIFRSYQVYPEEVIVNLLSDGYPLAAVHYLEANRPPGRLFNSYNWGGYLLWHLPEYPVFVDGRTDLYNEEILDQWFQVAQLKDGWEQVIEQWQIRVILMERDWRMAEVYLQHGWCQSYVDDIAIVLEKCR
ncbi:MAG: hypothetical protein Kow0088_06450 [Anaerolineales bacterium]